MEVREYREGDIQQVLITNVEKFLTKYVREDFILDSRNSAFTGVDSQGNIITCAGYVELWDGVFECWLALSDTYKGQFMIMFQFLKALKNALDMLDTYAVRIHAYVNVDLPNHEHFMRFLNFEPEAVLTDYFPNRNSCILYRRQIRCHN